MAYFGGAQNPFATLAGALKPKSSGVSGTPSAYNPAGTSSSTSQQFAPSSGGPFSPAGLSSKPPEGVLPPINQNLATKQNWMQQLHPTQFGSPNLTSVAPGTLTGSASPGASGGGAGAGGATGASAGGGTMGTESGPGILENWFNQRATGTDPAFEYASKRGLTDLGNRYSAAGAFNGGAARQGESDFMANLVSQRMGQLDSLAGGASGEHQGRLNSMFAQGLGLAGGQAGTAGAYDLGAGKAMSDANQASLMLALQKAGVDSQAAQSFINNVFGAAGTISRL